MESDKISMIIKENKEYFDLLKEYDETGILTKLKYKGRYTFTIDEELMNKFKKYAENKNQKMSNIIEKLIEKEINKS